jgi:E3 ubiquitin-protein ligase BRE1
LETQIARLKTAEKDLQLKLDRLSSEKDQMSDQLNAATLRFFKAEKKLDRAKSTQVQKLEQQAMASARGSATSEPDAGSTQVGETNGSSGELLMKYEEATATSTKQKEQLDNLLSEIKSIQDENSALKAKRESLSDEDFVRTDVFKQLKGQSEDLIKRINNLEATNKQLREEAEKLQAERSACRAQFENEANQVAQDLESEVAARDQDLARVRSARDEILAENTQRKSSMEQEKAAIDNLKDLLTAKDERISSLEHQISRLATEQDQDMTNAGVADELSPEELKTRYLKLEQDFKSINQELPAIEKAYKKMKDLAQKKVMDFATLEERLSILIAEKSKADQKYFAARKDADTRNNEIRSLRHQNSKSAEIIAQLKDLEAQTRSLLTNFEKQMADLKQTNTALVNDNKKFEAAANDASRRNETLGKQVAELTSLLKTKDSATAVMREKCATQETEVEKTKVRLDHMQKERDNWKSKALGNTSKEEEDLRVSLVHLRC